MLEFLEHHILEGAGDSMDQLVRSKSVAAKIESCLRSSLVVKEYIESNEACAIYVCAELVAAARGWPGMAIPALASIVEQHQDKIAELGQPATDAIEALRKGNNELWASAAQRDDLDAAASDLVSRLTRERVTPVTRIKRLRVQLGDVFRIVLSPTECAYLRLYQEHCCYVYNGIWRFSEKPPIGSRDFLFYTSMLPGNLGTAECTRVGRDPFGPDEPRSSLIYNGPKLLTTIFGTRFPTGVVAKPWQCLGMERAYHDDLETLRSRIIARRSSLDDSMEQFSGLLSPGDVEAALKALQGRVCRQFDEGENQRFQLIGQ